MSSTLPILGGIQVASPCDARWEEMTGDDRRRACAACGKDVHNLSALTVDEALALLSGPGPRPCVRFYRRRDGTVLTADCPVGLRAVRGRRLVRALAVGLGLAVTTTAGLAAALAFRRTVPATAATPASALTPDEANPNLSIVAGEADAIEFLPAGVMDATRSAEFLPAGGMDVPRAIELQPGGPPPRVRLQATLASWSDEALIAVGLRQRQVVMGDICLPPPHPVPPGQGPAAAPAVTPGP